MNLVTKVKVWGSALILITLAGLAYGAWDQPDGDVLTARSLNKELVLHVSFNRYTSHPVITVQLSKTPALSYESGNTGTWERVISVPSGSRVILGASQETTGYTELAIIDNGKAVPGSPDAFMGPGTLTVQHLVE